MRLRCALVVLWLLALAGCGSPSTAGSHKATPMPTDEPPANTFYFSTEDGVTLDGQIAGRGKTAIVFSNGKKVPQLSWQPVVEQLANRGYLTMTYDYRGISPSQGPDDPDQRDRDLRAAVGVVRARGATSVVLIGSSFGGTLTAALAAQVRPTAVVILSAPLYDGAIGIDDDTLRAWTTPKLFLASQDDTRFVGPIQHMYAMSPQPKQLHIYPGSAHGDQILTATATSEDAMRRLFAFLQTYAPVAA